jgi:tRNA dimethylallyltransferase
MATLPPLLVIAGATATGKTALGIRLAEAVLGWGRPVVVISADSRQVFRGLDIGTAKVTLEERGRVPHAGLDLVEPDEPFSVADFVTHAGSVLDDVGARDGVALLVGGTGLYLRAVARGIDTAALPSDPAVRAAIERDLAATGIGALVDRLRAIAPTRAAAIDLRNPRRVVRALEIAIIAGDAPPPPPRGYPGPVAWLGLGLDRTEHRRRIAQRARAQFDAGLIEEARALRERFDPTLPAFTAIGYHEAWSVIDGALTREAAIDLDAQRNAAFAKRQATWFRSEPGVIWLDAASPDALVPAATAHLERLLER